MNVNSKLQAFYAIPTDGIKNVMLEWSHLDSFPKPHSAEQTLVSVLNKLLLDLTVLIMSN